MLFDPPPSQPVRPAAPLEDLEGDLVGHLLVGHTDGVRVLLAPDQLQRAETIGGDDMQRVFDSLELTSTIRSSTPPRASRR